MYSNAAIDSTGLDGHNKADVRRLEGNRALQANDYAQATKCYTEAIVLCPELHLPWANRAECWIRMGKPNEALEDAIKCTELAPDYAKGWFRRGKALRDLKRLEEAICAFSRAGSLDPKNSQISDSIRMAREMIEGAGKYA